MTELLITHNDLDAVACTIAFRETYPDIEIQYHDYKTITQISRELLNGKDKNYDKIFFADISPEEKEGLDMLGLDVLGLSKYLIIDHHKTREYLNRERHLENVIFNIDYCAALLSYTWLHPGKEIPIFILAIDAWDSCKLDNEHREFGEELNLLLGYYKNHAFITRYENMPDMINDLDNIRIDVLKKIRRDYLKHKLDQVKTKIDEKGNKYWEVHIGEVQSGMGNLLEIDDKNKFPFQFPNEIKYLKTININDGLVSLYSLGFDVSEIAKENGGGGHTRSAGYTLGQW